MRNGDEPVKAEAAADKVSGGGEKTPENGEITVEESDVEMLAAVSEPSGRDFLLYYDPETDKVYPDDFSIGELQPFEGLDADTIAMLDAAEGFLTSIVNGDIDEGFVAAAKREFLRRNIEDQMDTLPAAYRLGVINTESDPVSARVRFIGETGYSDGVIYFIREGVWKIYDFHMDFSRMNEPAGNNVEGNLWETVSVE